MVWGAIACSPSVVSKPVEQPKPVASIKEQTYQKVLWINPSLAITIANRKDRPVLLYIQEDKYKPSLMMDLYTFSDPKVAEYINENFVAMRGSTDVFPNLPPGAIFILTPDGNDLGRMFGFVPPDDMVEMLKKAKELFKFYKPMLPTKQEVQVQ